MELGAAEPVPSLNRPSTDGSAKRCDRHLLEEVAESGIGRRTRQLDLQCGGQSRVLAEGEMLEITKALTTAPVAENRQQQQLPGRDPAPTTHP